MPRSSIRKRGRKKVQKKLPGGGTTIHYKKDKSSPAKCFRCGQMLHGAPRCHPSDIKRLTRSQRRIMRMYGGQLCANCLKELLKEYVRAVA